MWRLLPINEPGQQLPVDRQPIDVSLTNEAGVWIGRNTVCKLKDPLCSRQEIHIILKLSSPSHSKLTTVQTSTATATAGSKHWIQVARCNQLVVNDGAAVAGADWESKAPEERCESLPPYTLIGVLGSGGGGSGSGATTRKATYQLVPAEQLVIDWIKSDQGCWWPYCTPQDRPLSHLWVKNENSVEENCKILESGGVRCVSMARAPACVFVRVTLLHL